MTQHMERECPKNQCCEHLRGCARGVRGGGKDMKLQSMVDGGETEGRGEVGLEGKEIEKAKKDEEG